MYVDATADQKRERVVTSNTALCCCRVSALADEQTDERTLLVFRKLLNI